MPNPNEKSVNPLLRENVNFLRKFSGGDDRTELMNEVKSLLPQAVLALPDLDGSF
jgi:hypothetical protein